jgi:hypothetical protein
LADPPFPALFVVAAARYLANGFERSTGFAPRGREYERKMSFVLVSEFFPDINQTVDVRYRRRFQDGRALADGLGIGQLLIVWEDCAALKKKFTVRPKSATTGTLARQN